MDVPDKFNPTIRRAVGLFWDAEELRWRCVRLLLHHDQGQKMAPCERAACHVTCMCRYGDVGIGGIAGS